MNLYQTLSHPTYLTRLARWVLLCFAFALGAAIASPLIKPQSIELLCTGSGAVKMLFKNDTGEAVLASHAIDCSLCLNLSAPPPAAVALPALRHPLTYAVQPIQRARLATLTAPPLPARGPPAV